MEQIHPEYNEIIPLWSFAIAKCKLIGKHNKQNIVNYTSVPSAVIAWVFDNSSRMKFVTSWLDAFR